MPHSMSLRNPKQSSFLSEREARLKQAAQLSGLSDRAVSRSSFAYDVLWRWWRMRARLLYATELLGLSWRVRSMASRASSSLFWQKKRVAFWNCFYAYMHSHYIKIISRLSSQHSVHLPPLFISHQRSVNLSILLRLVWQIDIMMNSNQKGPINPEELFRRLMGADFREAECVDEASRLREQREILIQLIIEYEEEIKKVGQLALQQEDLLAYRQKLMLQLEQLRSQRQAIDARIGEEINTLRLTPVQVRSHSNLICQLEHVRACNSKIKIRIRDLMGYIASLQAQNRRLQEERQVITVNEMQRRQAGEDWRSKISLLQRQHLSYEQEVRTKMKSREAEVLRSIHAQEMEIKERNRVRMQSFREGKRTPMSTPYHRLDTREEEYFRKA